MRYVCVCMCSTSSRWSMHTDNMCAGIWETLPIIMLISLGSEHFKWYPSDSLSVTSMLLRKVDVMSLLKSIWREWGKKCDCYRYTIFNMSQSEYFNSTRHNFMCIFKCDGIHFNEALKCFDAETVLSFIIKYASRLRVKIKTNQH